MKPSDVKDAIVDYLEHIVNRINYINHHHPDTDLSLDIDLVKDDMRMLYGKLELLKTMALPKKININDEKAVSDNRYEKKTPVYDYRQTHQQHTATDFEQENQQTEPEVNRPSAINETHDSSKQPVVDNEVDKQPVIDNEADKQPVVENEADKQPIVDNEADKQPVSSPEKIIPEDESFNEFPKSESTPEVTSEKSPVRDEPATVLEKPTEVPAEKPIEVPSEKPPETTQEIVDTPDVADISETTGFTETDTDADTAVGAESNSEPNNLIEPEQQTIKPDLQYHQSGMDFADSKTAPAANEASDRESDALNKQSHLKEDDNNLKEKVTKSVIELLSANRKKTIGDRYVEADNSLNKRISADKEDQSIGARMQQQPISNIRDVIGVNEKFLFVNELFDGDIRAYHDAIVRLNSMQHMQEAFDYLNVLSEKFSWDANNAAATIEKLANYVQRRYMK